MATLLLVCLFALADAPHASMSADFLGEPKVISDMRIGDSFWLPAHCLTVDADGKCWLDPDQKLDVKEPDHRLNVQRKKVEGKVVYTVYIYKDWLQGWRWKKTKETSEQHKREDRLIPVAYLSASFKRRSFR